ncbi:MAG TPA: trypsin-like peptidase domain-containing protein [Pirellulales bacterium]|jgi:S1-C subfamily serine protease
MQDFDYNRPPSPPPPPPRRPLALFFLLALLVVVAALPYLVERVQYAAARGKMRARADVASEELAKLSTTAGLVTLADTSRVFSLVAQKVELCVVHIDVEQLAGSGQDEMVFRLPGRRQQMLQGQGSGFVVDSAGYILTNRHVVENATAIQVNLADGRTIKEVSLVGDDELTDLAVLKINAPDLTSVVWGKSEDLDVGDWVLAIGNPYGLDRTVTCGIVSATQRRKIAPANSYQDFLQTDAAVNPGNSGGPLVNMVGQVVGVNTAIVGRSYQGISFSIPSETARHSYEQIIKNGRVPRGWLGVRFQELNEQIVQNMGLPSEHGALVAEVLANSPASAAGVEAGDVIVEWNGRAVVDATDLVLAVAASDVGSTAKVIVWRNGAKQTIEVKVGQRPDNLRGRR